MTNLKTKIEKIFEAPIPDTDMPTSHYLNDDRAFRAANKNIAPLLKLIRDYIKNMSWREITLESNGEQQITILPEALRNMMSSLYTATSEYCKPLDIYRAGRHTLNAKEKTLYNKIAHFNLSTVTVSADDPLATNVSNLRVFKDVAGTNSNHYIYTKGRNPGDRTHFPNNGINKGLSGLGQKIYRAMINNMGWAQTNDSGTGIKDLMWDSLTDYKYMADGVTRDVENEIYSFRIAHWLFAISTTITVNKIVEYGYKIINDNVSNKSYLASAVLRKANNIAIDPDFIALVKRHLPHLSATLKSKALEMLDWLEPDPARVAEIERLIVIADAETAIVRAAQAKANANILNASIADRLMAFCGVNRVQDLDSNWAIGDWVVIKSYLLDGSDQIKVRKIVKKTGANYIALKNTDLAAFNDDGTITDGRNATNDTRSLWVKALPPAVGHNVPPGTFDVLANTRRESTTITTAAAATPTPVSNQSLRDNIQSLFSEPANKETTLNIDNVVRKKFLTRKIDNNFIYISYVLPVGYITNGIPIFGYMITGDNVKTMYNSKTMEDVRLAPTDWTAIKTILRKYERVPVSDKRELSPGSLVFIKQHSKYFGYVAQVLSTSLTGRGDKYVYLRVHGAGTSNRLTLTPPSNRLTLTPSSLDKLVPFTDANESFSSTFESYLAIARNKPVIENIDNTPDYFELTNGKFLLYDEKSFSDMAGETNYYIAYNVLDEQPKPGAVIDSASATYKDIVHLLKPEDKIELDSIRLQISNDNLERSKNWIE